jgi:hypothetical protein
MTTVADDDARLVRLENKLDAVQTNMARRDDLIRLVDSVAKIGTDMIPRIEYEPRHEVLQKSIDSVRKDLGGYIEAMGLAMDKRISELAEPAAKTYEAFARDIEALQRQVLPQWAVTGLVTIGAGYALYRLAVPHP